MRAFYGYSGRFLRCSTLLPGVITPIYAIGLVYAVVRMLVERGARLDLKDMHYDGTAADWAEYAGRVEIADYLRARRRSQPFT